MVTLSLELHGICYVPVFARQDSREIPSTTPHAPDSFYAVNCRNLE